MRYFSTPLPRIAVALVTMAVIVPTGGAAQFSDPPPPAAYALEGVTVVRADGSRTPGVTIVVRNKLIRAMGPGIAVPADAKVLEADSLIVYPGLIDAQGQAKHAFAERDISRDTLASWHPPRDVQGFQPHRRVVDALTASGTDFTSERANGVVAGGVHPAGPLMPGRGVLVLFRPGATAPHELVLKSELAPYFSFARPRGVYPSTLFGAMAFFRQMFEDARRDGVVQAAYAADPIGLAPPVWDPDLAILRAVLRGERVFFEAHQAEDIRNAISLAQEYGFRPVIVGGQEASRVAALLRQTATPVLVSLDFPKPSRWKPPAKHDSTAGQEPLDAAAEREKREIEAVYRNAAALAAAGVTFALTSGGGKTDLLEGARKAVEYGLDAQQALAALTSTPADLLGMPQLVRIETGMPATFVVADGPLFDDDTRIAYTFVEGVMERGAARPSGEPPTVDVSGRWQMTIVVPGEEFRGTMEVTQTAGAFRGTLSLGELGVAQVVDGSVSGSRLTFNLIVSMGGQELTLEASGTVEGERATGSGSGPMGGFEWAATRAGTPQGARP